MHPRARLPRAIGEILHEEDRWWPRSTTDELRQQLEWIVLQLHAKADGYLLRHPLP